MENHEHPIGSLMDGTIAEIRKMADVNMVIGDPILTPDNITIIPVSKVTFGFTAGGSDFGGKKDPAVGNNFGGGAGAGVNIIPVAFLVVKDGSVRVMGIAPPATTTVDRIIDQAPAIIDKIEEFIKSRKEKKEDEQAAESFKAATGGETIKPEDIAF
ncbi:MAG: GerW family sporulation protein [Oscillospiraceae bacterium]|jgi:sporulation protein YtfJ|nr:GerW family sporulation protein [Oscillospiraceae bacterium]